MCSDDQLSSFHAISYSEILFKTPTVFFGLIKIWKTSFNWTSFWITMYSNFICFRIKINQKNVAESSSFVFENSLNYITHCVYTRLFCTLFFIVQWNFCSNFIFISKLFDIHPKTISNAVTELTYTDFDDNISICS